MFQQFYEPHPALKGFVDNIMIHQMKFDALQAQLNFFIPPLPVHGLIFYIRDRADSENISTEIKETLPPCLIVGPNINRHIITAGRDHLIINVAFQPGGLYRFLGIPMNELLCKDGFDGAELLGNEINDVHNRLQEAISFTNENNCRNLSD